MSELIPFTVSDNNYRLAVPLDGTTYLLDVRWNSRDAAWYLNIYTEDELPIAHGLKLVMGSRIGSHSPHQFFKDHVLVVMDTTGEDRDAAYDDLGARVVVLHMMDPTKVSASAG